MSPLLVGRRGPGPRAPTWLALLLAVSAALLLAVSAAPLAAQVEDPPQAAGSDALRVFLDCSEPGCDQTHFRREITFVNWVLEPQDGQVHVIVTSEAAGGGGRRYALDVLGREALDGLSDRFTYTSGATDVSAEVRDGLTHTLRLALVRYATLAGFGGDLEVRGLTPEETGPGTPAAPQDDPWDFWVFTVGLNGNGFSEDQASQRSLGFSLSANRTTEAWKIETLARANFSRFETRLTDSTTYVDERNTWSAAGLVVRSLGEHWGAGTELEASNSVSQNRDLLVGLGGGVEWDYFPYSESTRRSLLARYVVNVEYVNYETTTIFGKDTDVLLRHQTGLTYAAQEPWGRANLGVSASHFLDQPDFYRIDFEAFVDWRIVRGLRLFFNLRHSITNDQIYLSGEGLTDEERLLRRRQLASDSFTFYGVGFSFRFGSIFNNAVNTRFPGGVR